MTHGRQERGDRLDWRVLARALAVLGLILQSVAPLEIAPPDGQAVHFAHLSPADICGHHPDGPAKQTHHCPVCQMLSAAHAVAAGAVGLLRAAAVAADRFATVAPAEGTWTRRPENRRSRGPPAAA